jgi:heptosyltransferase II
MSRPIHILILKWGALGDVVRTSYILPGLHERFGKGTVVTWVTTASALPLLRFNPYVANLIPADQCEAGTLPDEFAGVTFDWVLSFDDEADSCRLANNVDARRISGAYLSDGAVRYSEDTSAWFDMGLISRFGKEKADQMKIINQYSHDEIFAGMLGIKITQPSFYNNPMSEERARAVAELPSGQRVGLNLSAGKRWASKSLRMEEAIQLVGLLQGLDVNCVLLGGVADEEYLGTLSAETGTPAISRLSLDCFAGVIRELDLLITSDSLALHLAIAQRVPSVSYYAPTSAAEINTFGTGAKIVSTAADYCSYRPDADNSTITAKRIFAEAVRLLEIPRASVL